MNRKIVLLGAGGHARVILACLATRELFPMGVVCLGSEDAFFAGVPILGDDSALEALGLHETELALGVGSLERRRFIFERWKSIGARFLSVIHKFSWVAPDVTLGEGAQIMAGAIIQPGVLLGDNVLINTSATVDHDCIVGRHVHVAPGAAICGGCTIEDDVHIGAGAVIREGMFIAQGSFVAAGAVVVRSIMQPQVVRGVPARPYKDRVDPGRFPRSVE